MLCYTHRYTRRRSNILRVQISTRGDFMFLYVSHIYSIHYYIITTRNTFDTCRYMYIDILEYYILQIYNNKQINNNNILNIIKYNNMH